MFGPVFSLLNSGGPGPGPRAPQARQGKAWPCLFWEAEPLEIAENSIVRELTSGFRKERIPSARASWVLRKVQRRGGAVRGGEGMGRGEGEGKGGREKGGKQGLSRQRKAMQYKARQCKELLRQAKPG